jgi:hypothetical protein
MKRLLLLFLVVAALMAQSGATRTYYVYRSVVGTSNIISIRQPAFNGREIHLMHAFFSCSAGCTWTISKNGSLSGGTTGTINALDDRGNQNTAGATYDGTITSDTTVNSDTLTAAGTPSILGCVIAADRNCYDGLVLSWDGTTRKMINLKLTAGGSTTLTIYGVYGEQ